MGRRASTVRALDFLPPHQRYQLMQALVDDEIKTVRMEVAASLAGVPPEQLSPQQAAALGALFDEYIDTLAHIMAHIIAAETRACLQDKQRKRFPLMGPRRFGRHHGPPGGRRRRGPPPGPPPE